MDQAGLDQVQAEEPHFLVLLPVRGQLPLAPDEDEVVGGVPALHHVQPFVHLPAQILGGEVAAEEDGLDGAAQLYQGLVRRMLGVVAGETAEQALRVGRAPLHRHRVLDHGVEVLLDEVTIDGAGGHDRREVRVVLPRFGRVELLLANGLDARHQFEAEQAAEGEGHQALAVGVHEVAHHAFDQRRGLGGGDALELGVDADGFPLDVPVDHDTAAAVAHVPLGKQVLVPSPELLGVRRAARRGLSPELGKAGRQRGVDHLQDGLAHTGSADARRAGPGSCRWSSRRPSA